MRVRYVENEKAREMAHGPYRAILRKLAPLRAAPEHLFTESPTKGFLGCLGWIRGPRGLIIDVVVVGIGSLR